MRSLKSFALAGAVAALLLILTGHTPTASASASVAAHATAVQSAGSPGDSGWQ